MEDSAQSKFSGPSDNKSDHSDDVASGDVESALKAENIWQLHNYFSVPALQPMAEEKVQMANDSNSSHVISNWKIIGLCCPRNSKKKIGTNFTSETED